MGDHQDEMGEALQQTGAPGAVQVGAMRVDGFRGLLGTELTLRPSMTVLLGENNSGKTSVLHALATALRARRATEEDLHIPPEGPRRDQFVVDVCLLPASGTEFSEEAAAVLDRGIVRGPEDGDLAVIRATGQLSADGSGVTVTHAFLSWWPEPGRQEPERMSQPPVTNRVLDLVDFTLLDAQRDLVEQLRQRHSTWGQLLSRLEISDEEASAIEADLSRLGEQIVGASRLLAKLREELSGVRDAIGSSVADVSLAPLPPRLEELARGIDVLVATPNAASIPLRLQGMGSRSLAALMVFRAFTALRLGADQPVQPTPLIAIEEPEAHLHPQAHRAVTTLIDKIPGQKLVSTHSPRVVRTADLADVRYVRRDGLAVRVNAPAATLTNEEQAKLGHLVMRPHGEALFARLVVIGDGKTEADALPVFMGAHWSTEPDALGVTVVEVPSLGDSQTQALVAFLEECEISWLALVDGDDAGQQAVAAMSQRVDRDLTQARELVWLPQGHAFERHLVAEGFADAARDAIVDFYGQEALEEFAQARRPDANDEELVFHFLCKHKASYGAPVAEAIVARQDAGQSSMPSQVRALLDRADELLERR
jgi:putative ATP-dependent endonuclease of OLD family